MVIRMRHTKSHTKNRRSHHALKSTNFTKCTNCQTLKRRHNVCSNCGFYRGKKILDLIKREERKQKKLKEKQSRT
ncbi:50S ribosomal protein L32 [Candidatus Nomurabacteria bacterium CG10_big_fil_rev_8_21_14_0_10_35_16]|uniref:Large ribosomal subunit protein bL32 n=1 Tax=Candidatus Nomurabacteria bacterium CG10_big_fil_rev_8_21_14_0_10_35_16 TaxID=1974731 RepID=A0A2H0TD17_9BACT|nr:MAG: 50S ribosomal protein L32 [Candidatus Nomurabacteria bacterium CG10_big_fil_rev_8_21_14_0_10_35_16]